MPTNRIPINRKSRTGRITDEVLEAYRVARKLYDESAIDEWGGRSEQCNQACSRLHDLLGGISGDIDVISDTNNYIKGWGTPEEFQAALAIRRELEQQAAAY
jgi:hypothetical protein